MRRYVNCSPIIGNSKHGEIVIDGKGMSVDNKEPSYLDDDTVIESFLDRCIDLDSWKHSWHMELGKAKIMRSDERKKVRTILESKISDRIKEIQMLKDALQVLGRWHY